jgi:hypothetical protein
MSASTGMQPALKRPELGSLRPGCAGDATILSIKNGRFDYVDVVEEHLNRRPQDRRGRLVVSALSDPDCFNRLCLLTCHLIRNWGNTGGRQG